MPTRSSERHASVHIIYEVLAHAHAAPCAHTNTPTHIKYANISMTRVRAVSSSRARTGSVFDSMRSLCHRPHLPPNSPAPQLVSYTWYFSIVRRVHDAFETSNNFISRWNTHRLCAARARVICSLDCMHSTPDAERSARAARGDFSLQQQSIYDWIQFIWLCFVIGCSEQARAADEIHCYNERHTTGKYAQHETTCALPAKLSTL